jgi:hypothetical protein
MQTALIVLVTSQLVLSAPRKIPYVPDAVFPPVPEDGKNNHHIEYITTLAT